MEGRSGLLAVLLHNVIIFARMEMVRSNRTILIHICVVKILIRTSQDGCVSDFRELVPGYLRLSATSLELVESEPITISGRFHLQQ